jgi:cyanophycin synthetase
VLVIGGRVVAASRRDPAQVTGDGRHTIAELVEIVNRDPRRGDDHATVLSKLVLDPIALQVLDEQGYSFASVPQAGHRVLIRRNANLSTGGTASDVTDRVHHEVAARSVEAARIIGLDVAGVDVIAQDIGRPLEEQSGVIIEVNAAPGLRMHLEPSSGTPRPVGESIISLLYPEGETGRVPIVAVTGVNGKTTTTRLIAQMVRQSGKTVGMTCTDGVRIGERWIDTGDCSGPKSARAVLLNPRVEAAVLETARGGILREGLGFDLCDVAVVTNMGEGDHLGLGEIHTLEKLALVKRTIVDVVAPTGSAVLNAADPLVAEMAPKCPGSVIFFARDSNHPVIAAHLGRGGRAVFVRHEAVVLAEGDEETVLIALARVPLTLHGRIEFQVENVLAACAAAWSLGLPHESVVTVLEVFNSDLRQTPGRFNVLPHGEATIVLDYGHNPSALLALVDAIARLPHQRRLTVFSAAGDRRDQDIVRQGEIIGDHFDFAVLFEDACNRGRPDGAVIALLRQGIANGQRLSGSLETRGELVAIETALSRLRAGDLLYIQPDQVELTLGFVQNYLATHPPVVARDRIGEGVIIAV